jgi:osmotically-inducible protein OsmY
VIRKNVLQQLKYVSSIYEPDKIKVNVDNGIVFLEGNVSFYREKLMAKTVATWQQGVKGVENRIDVMQPEKAKSDENLKEVLTHVLEDEFPVEDNVKFTVDDGTVTLNGTATTLWAKFNIEEEFLNVIGIRVVDNNLVVEPIL